jgi:hypothetical protein
MQAENKTLSNQLHPELISPGFVVCKLVLGSRPGFCRIASPILSFGLNRRWEIRTPQPVFAGCGPGFNRPRGGKKGRISLLLAKIPLYTAPSHTETWLKRPSGGSRAEKARLLTRFRRNQPEN